MTTDCLRQQEEHRNAPPGPRFFPGWQQDCRAPLWQPPAPLQHTAPAEDTAQGNHHCFYDQDHRELYRVIIRNKKTIKKANCQQRSLISRQTCCTSFLTSVGPSFRSEVISTQRSYRSRSFLKSRVSCRRCSWSFPKRSWYVAWLWVTPLGSWIKDTMTREFISNNYVHTCHVGSQFSVK